MLVLDQELEDEFDGDVDEFDDFGGCVCRVIRAA